MKFQHLLITRFNIRNLSFDGGKSKEEWEQWTRNRVTLFLEFCLPSVVNQSNQNFTWLIFVDASTPGDLLKELTTKSQAPNIKWCVVESTDNFNQLMVVRVKKEIDSRTEWIMTTNLDNDDKLHQVAIEYIQTNFLPVQNHLIYLSSG